MQLPALKTADGQCIWLDVSQSETIAQLSGLDLSENSNQIVLDQILKEAVQSLANQTSAVAVDYRSASEILVHKPARTGVLYRLTEYRDPGNWLEAPTILPNWGVEETADNYGVVLLPLYYHPNEAQALVKKQFVAEMYDFCRYQQVACVLQLNLIGDQGAVLSKEERASTQLSAVQEFRDQADALVLEYPGTALAAATLTAELDIPWVVADDFRHHEEYELFKQDLRTALEAGARGVMVGPQIWQGWHQLRTEDARPDLVQIEQFLKTTARDRMIEIERIVAEAAIEQI